LRRQQQGEFEQRGQQDGHLTIGRVVASMACLAFDAVTGSHGAQTWTSCRQRLS
jgi:hypothetical protein